MNIHLEYCEYSYVSTGAWILWLNYKNWLKKHVNIEIKRQLFGKCNIIKY